MLPRILALLIVVGCFAGAARTAPKGKPALPEFDPVVVVGRWDGDTAAPWVYVAGPAGEVVYQLVFPTAGAQAVAVGPLARDQRVRVVGVPGTTGPAGGQTLRHYLLVVELTPE